MERAGRRGGRPLKPVQWQEDAEQVREWYRQEAVAELRTRRPALWLVRAGQTLRAGAQALGVDEASVSPWLSWYRTGGVVEVRRHRHGGRQGRASFLTGEQQAQLKAEASRGTFRTAAQAREWIARQCGVHSTVASIYTLLRRLRIHPKRPRPQAEKASPEAQAAWKKGD